MNNNQLTKTDDPWEESAHICARIGNDKKPDPKDIERLGQLAVREPRFLLANSTTQSIRHHLIEKISNGAFRAVLFAELDLLKTQFDYDVAPPLERLLIDQVLTARLRLIHAENCYSSYVMNQSITFKTGEFWEKVLSSTQARFIKAIEVLAKVRRAGREHARHAHQNRPRRRHTSEYLWRRGQCDRRACT